MLAAMGQYDDAEMRSRDEAAQRRLEIYEIRADAIQRSEHGWRSFLLLVVDSMAAGVVAGIGLAAGLLQCLFVWYAWQYSVATILLLALAPLVALALLVLAMMVGPLRLSTAKHPKIIANGLMFAWCAGTLIFSCIVLVAAAP